MKNSISFKLLSGSSEFQINFLNSDFQFPIYSGSPNQKAIVVCNQVI